MSISKLISGFRHWFLTVTGVNAAFTDLKIELSKNLAEATDSLREQNRFIFNRTVEELTLANNKAGLHSGYVDPGTQKLLAIKYRECAQRGEILSFLDVAFRNHSQTGEDGILLYIFALIGVTNRTVVEMCAGNGKECNATNLILNEGWTGLLFDGDDNNIEISNRFFSEHPNTACLPPKVVKGWITAENINSVISENGVSGEIDLFSLDVDGVDYWLLKALDVISPRVIVLEFQAIWMAEESVTIPYSPDFKGYWVELDGTGRFAQYGGASLKAFVSLAKYKGYRLVGGNSMNYNAFFVRNDVGQEYFPEVTPASIFTNPIVGLMRDATLTQFSLLDWQKV